MGSRKLFLVIVSNAMLCLLLQKLLLFTSHHSATQSFHSRNNVRESAFTERKGAIVQFYDENTYQTYSGAIENVKCYAKINGYTYIFEEKTNAKDVFFARHLVVEKHFDNFDIIMALDADVFIANFTKRIEDYLLPNIDVYLTQRFMWGIEVAAGYQIYRVSDFSRRFVKNWNNFYYNRTTPFTDNGALMMLLIEYYFNPNDQNLIDFSNLYSKIQPWDNAAYFSFLRKVRDVVVKENEEKFKVNNTFGIKVSTWLNGFSRDCEDHGRNHEFWAKLLPTDFVVHSKFPHYFISKDFNCINETSHRGPAYEKRFQFDNTLVAMKTLANLVSDYSEHVTYIPFCYPICQDFWKFPRLQ